MKLIAITCLSLFIVSSSAIAMSVKYKPFFRFYSDFKAEPTPVLKTSNFPILSAQGAIVVDLTTRSVLYQKDPDKRLLPASTTKITTALVTLDSYNLGDVIKVNKMKVEGQKMGLVAGEDITIDSLLYGLLVYSGNDAAEVLAENYPGGKEKFIEAMNKKALDLGLLNTSFTNPAGFEDPEHFSTARDLVALSEYAMKNREFADIVATKEKDVASVDNRIVHKLVNINKLLGAVPGVLGVKTGWTENARESLVTYIDRDGKKLMIALLGSQDRFGETKELIDWTYMNYEWKDFEKDEPKFYYNLSDSEFPLRVLTILRRTRS